MRRVITALFLFFICASTIAGVSPRITFSDLMIQAEENASVFRSVRKLALEKDLPVTIMTKDRKIIEAKGIEDGRIVYAVINDLLNPYNNGQVLFFEEISSVINLNEARIIYGGGRTIDNTGGIYDPVISNRSGAESFYMVTDWTYDRVYLFNAQNGDLVDTAFIHSSNPQLQSPKEALQTYYKTQILVSDQISDAVQRFDTNGLFVNLFAPAGGVNTGILDNIRGIAYKPNNHLLVTVASGASQNTIQEFDTAGAHIGTFINTNLNSPFCILYRSGDILISNSSGTNRISKFNFSGTFISSFYTGSAFAFPQQMIRLENGMIIVAGFSTPSGIAVLDSSGNFIRLMNTLTSIRGLGLLENGHYLVSNSTGVHEVDTASGSLIRTVVTGTNFQYVDKYIPDGLVSIGTVNEANLDYKLYDNYPNPFNPSTTIKFYIKNNERVSLNVYDISGKKVTELINEVKAAGNHEITFDAKDLSSGIYFYEIKAGNFKDQKKMVLLK